MVNVHITGTLDGLRIIDRQLQGIEERASDLTPAYGEVRRVFAEIVARAFATEGASGASGPWAPLAKSTQAERKAKGYAPDHPILERDSRLRRSLVEDTGDTIKVETPRSFAIGSRAPSVAYHQSLEPRTRLPRRPVFDPTGDDKHALVQPLRRYVTGYEPAV